ncbi:MAG: hypothetical protein ACYCSF_00605 [Acidimicrobiales bacterium]
MLASITPLGERGRGNRWWLTTFAYELGSLCGGAATGAVAGGVGIGIGALVQMSSPTRLVVGAVITLAALVADGSQRHRPVPSWRRQVDKGWLDRYRGWVYGAGFGVQLGAGVVTIVSSTATYAWIGLAVVVASPRWGALIGALFGLVRAAPLLGFAGAHDFSTLQRSHRRLQALGLASRIGTMTVLGAATVLLAVVSSLRTSS